MSFIEVGILAAVICVLLITVIWLWISKQEQAKAVALLQQKQPRRQHHQQNKDKLPETEPEPSSEEDDFESSTLPRQHSDSWAHNEPDKQHTAAQQHRSTTHRRSTQSGSPRFNQPPGHQVFDGTQSGSPWFNQPPGQQVFDGTQSDSPRFNQPPAHQVPVFDGTQSVDAFFNQPPSHQMLHGTQSRGPRFNQPAPHQMFNGAQFAAGGTWYNQPPAHQMMYSSMDSWDMTQQAQVNTIPVVSRCATLLKSSTCIEQGSPSTFKLPVKITQTETEGIEKGEIGNPPHISKPSRVFMAVGATGAGKTTLINGMLNYILGVKWDDDFRFKLITDEGDQSQAHSQTQKITSYTIYWQEGSPIDYNLIIVDTPGFGDTRGLQRDKEITAQIKAFFSIKGDSGIDQIHGIGFVVQSSLARLTHTQKYVFDSVLSVFGKDIAKNIFIMSTFADGGSVPPVKGAIKAANVPYCSFLEFNNEFIFTSNTNKFTKSFWDMVYDSFKEFFTHFTRTETVSLQLTRTVLKERQQLESILTGLQKRISVGVAKIDELNQEEEVLRKHESRILANKDFNYTVTVTKQRKIDISGKGVYVTNCLTCNFTCHSSCIYNDDGDKYRCSAMDNGGQGSAKCEVCPGQCHWRQHKNNSFYYELYEEDEIRTSADLKARFQDASTAKTGVQGMIAKMEKELEDLHNGVFLDIRQARQCIQRLDEIALKRNPLTDADYISLLIQSEQSEKKPGFLKRIQYLTDVKEGVELMEKFGDADMEKVSREGAKSWWKKIQPSDKKIWKT